MTTLLKAAKAFAKANPTRDGGSWSQWCGSLMFRFNGHEHAYSTVDKARAAVRLESAVASRAPIGAFHFFGNNHVMQDMVGGGRSCFTASAHLTADEELAPALGLVSVWDYMSRTGANYLGWATTYGSKANPSRPASDLGKPYTPPKAAVKPALREIERNRVRRISRYLNARAKRLRQKTTYASVNGIRGIRYWRLVQAAAKADGMYGRGYIINGIPGPASRRAEVVYSNLAS